MFFHCIKCKEQYVMVPIYKALVSLGVVWITMIENKKISLFKEYTGICLKKKKEKKMRR